jgi:hypothetical protein
MLRRLLPFAAVLLFSALALAQGGPPLQTDDPGTPGNNNWEINLAFLPDLRGTSRSYNAPILDLNYGVGDRIQLKYQVPYLLQSTAGGPLESGLGKSLAGVKWRFFQDDAHQLNISTYPQLEFNNPTDSVRRGLADPGTRLLLPFEITKEVHHLELNAEVGWWFSGSGVDGHVFGFAAGHQITRRFELLAEIYRLTDKNGTEFDTTYGAGGRYQLSIRLLFIFMAGRGFGGPPHAQPGFIGYFGLQFQIEHKKP